MNTKEYIRWDSRQDKNDKHRQTNKPNQASSHSILISTLKIKEREREREKSKS